MYPLQVDLGVYKYSDVNLTFRIRVYITDVKTSNMTMVAPSFTDVSIRIGCYQTSILDSYLKLSTLSQITNSTVLFGVDKEDGATYNLTFPHPY